MAFKQVMSVSGLPYLFQGDNQSLAHFSQTQSMLEDSLDIAKQERVHKE